MPAEITTGLFCASTYGDYVVASSTTGLDYVVTLGGLSGAYCDCAAYKYAKETYKSCKHIEAVYLGSCQWNCQWNDGHNPITHRPFRFDNRSVVHGETCPNCGGPVVSVRIAV